MKKLLIVMLILAVLVIPAYGADETVGVCLDYMDAQTALYAECALGDYTADAMRESLGTDVSVIPGSMISGELGYGSITEEDVLKLFANNDLLVTVTISPSELKEMLERSVSETVLTDEETIDAELSASDAFLQVSGFRFVYNPAAEAGERVMSVTLDSGGELDLFDKDPYLTLCAPLSVVQDEYAVQTESAIRLSDAFSSYLHDHGTSPATLNRIRAAGSGENTIISMIPKSLLWAALVVFLLFGILSPKIHEKKADRKVQKSKVFSKDYFYQ